MALDSIGLAMIAPLVKGARVLALGYPDLTASREEVRELLGLSFDEGPNPLDTAAVLILAGAAAFDVVDLIAHKGIERIVDLNEPQAWPRRHGLVINPGTLEHCFNLGQAWANAWSAVDLGGWILHVAPASMLNHGFWNVNPLALEEWCRANGGRVRDLRFATNGTREPVAPQPIEASLSGRGQLQGETVLYALCQKLVDLPLKWPVQACYRRAA